ncbi:MAG: ABC transporter permease [Micrococcaceae bacterium]
MNNTADTDFLPEQGPNQSSGVRRVLAQGAYETRTTLSNGEQLLVALILPMMALVALSVTGILDDGQGHASVDVAVPGIFALAVLSSGLTGQGIATGFDRRYGVLTYLSTTPLGSMGLLLGKIVAVMMVLLVQLIVLGAIGAFLGWSPEWRGAVFAALFILIGAVAFTGIGLFIAGTVRPEATLALTNLLWVVLGAAGGIIFPIPAGPGTFVLHLLPSTALGDGLRSALIQGDLAVTPLVVLAAWGAVAVAGTIRWFKWR